MSGRSSVVATTVVQDPSRGVWGRQAHLFGRFAVSVPFIIHRGVHADNVVARALVDPAVEGTRNVGSLDPSRASIGRPRFPGNTSTADAWAADTSVRPAPGWRTRELR